MARSGGRRKWTIYLQKSSAGIDTQHLLDVLLGRQVTLAEWLCMWQAEDQNWPDAYPNYVTADARRFLHMDVPYSDCEAGFASCLQKGWLLIHDEGSVQSIHTLLATDETLQPVPPKHLMNFVDFTPTGAALYRQLAGEIFGEHWEESLWVTQESYREEHHYSESQSSFERVFQEIEQEGEQILAMQTVPIGPWCVYWWEQFPAGFRLELQIGSG